MKKISRMVDVSDVLSKIFLATLCVCLLVTFSCLKPPATLAETSKVRLLNRVYNPVTILSGTARPYFLWGIR